MAAAGGRTFVLVEEVDKRLNSDDSSLPSAIATDSDIIIATEYPQDIAHHEKATWRSSTDQRRLLAIVGGSVRFEAKTEMKWKKRKTLRIVSTTGNVTFEVGSSLHCDVAPFAMGQSRLPPEPLLYIASGGVFIKAAQSVIMEKGSSLKCNDLNSSLSLRIEADKNIQFGEASKIEYRGSGDSEHVDLGGIQLLAKETITFGNHSTLDWPRFLLLQLVASKGVHFSTGSKMISSNGHARAAILCENGKVHLADESFSQFNSSSTNALTVLLRPDKVIYNEQQWKKECDYIQPRVDGKAFFRLFLSISSLGDITGPWPQSQILATLTPSELQIAREYDNSAEMLKALNEDFFPRTLYYVSPRIGAHLHCFSNGQNIGTLDYMSSRERILLLRLLFDMKLQTFNFNESNPLLWKKEKKEKNSTWMSQVPLQFSFGGKSFSIWQTYTYRQPGNFVCPEMGSYYQHYDLLRVMYLHYSEEKLESLLRAARLTGKPITRIDLECLIDDVSKRREYLSAIYAKKYAELKFEMKSFHYEAQTEILNRLMISHDLEIVRRLKMKALPSDEEGIRLNSLPLGIARGRESFSLREGHIRFDKCIKVNEKTSILEPKLYARYAYLRQEHVENVHDNYNAAIANDSIKCFRHMRIITKDGIVPIPESVYQELVEEYGVYFGDSLGM